MLTRSQLEGGGKDIVEPRRSSEAQTLIPKVCTETGFSNGVHWWSVSKMMRSHAGEKGRLGVVVMVFSILELFPTICT